MLCQESDYENTETWFCNIDDDDDDDAILKTLRQDDAILMKSDLLIMWRLSKLHRGDEMVEPFLKTNKTKCAWSIYVISLYLFFLLSSQFHDISLILVVFFLTYISELITNHIFEYFRLTALIKNWYHMISPMLISEDPLQQIDVLFLNKYNQSGNKRWHQNLTRLNFGASF